MTTITAPGLGIALRVELLDYINCLVKFATDKTATGDVDAAINLMKWNKVDADELNARTADVNRPTYRPLPHQR